MKFILHFAIIWNLASFSLQSVVKPQIPVNSIFLKAIIQAKTAKDFKKDQTCCNLPCVFCQAAGLPCCSASSANPFTPPPFTLPTLNPCPPGSTFSPVTFSFPPISFKTQSFPQFSTPPLSFPTQTYPQYSTWSYPRFSTRSFSRFSTITFPKFSTPTFRTQTFTFPKFSTQSVRPQYSTRTFPRFSTRSYGTFTFPHFSTQPIRTFTYPHFSTSIPTFPPFSTPPSFRPYSSWATWSPGTFTYPPWCLSTSPNTGAPTQGPTIGPITQGTTKQPCCNQNCFICQFLGQKCCSQEEHDRVALMRKIMGNKYFMPNPKLRGFGSSVDKN